MRLDPRTWLVVTIGYSALVAMVPLTWAPALYVLVLAVVVGVGAFRPYLRWLRWASLTVLSWFLITWLASDVPTALLASARLLAIFSVFFLFFHRVPPEDLANALVASGLPYEVAFVFSTGLAFVPVISRRAREVVDAQRARGIPLEPGWKALPHYPALLIPLLAQAFTLADQLSEALESRGFGRRGRSFVQPYRLSVLDWSVIALVIVALLVAWRWR